MNDATLKQIGKRVSKRVAKTLSKPATRLLELPVAQLDRDVLDTFDACHQREWLVTNGIGGFAAGTVGGCNTRRYHGLLIASLRPPVERVVMVSKLDVIARYAGKTFSLATNEFADGTIDPHGYCNIHSFRMEGQSAIWTWLIGDALLEQRIWISHGQNSTYVRFEQLSGDQSIQLEVHPLCTYRDYHWQHHGYRDAALHPIDDGVNTGFHKGLEIVAYPQAQPYRILIEKGNYSLNQQWYWNFKHREESARGLDDTEDLFRPAIITIDLQASQASTIVLTTESMPIMSAEQSLQHQITRQQELLARATLDKAALAMPSPTWIQQLVLAADQFIVERRDAHQNVLGKTVIAGYPWFSDWGRDTMIALPGLCISTGRYDVAASILRTFAKFVSEGMLPNRFPDAGETPEYNTVDATLWYFVAVYHYLRNTDDSALRSELYPVLKDIIEWHLRGTRYNIHMDQEDGLLLSGEAGVQLTWMDAKVGDWVVTPRTGKCVEINALWFNALSIMVELANQERDTHAAQRFVTLAEFVASSFEQRFWYEQGGYLYDVIDDPNVTPDKLGERRDTRLRPNQLFAISLPFSLLSNGRARQVVDLCAKELWTPVGLRSLAVTDPRYVANYRGGPVERDGAYHQGTVWSWLLGPFIEAHLRVHGDVTIARNYLQGMAAHLRAACIGQVSEIFDGDAPFAPRGCVAQAWGVSEVLRVWSEINER